MRDSVTFIQAHWRSYHCRRKIKRFSLLPLDIWWLIVQRNRMINSMYRCIERIISLRIVRLNWSPPSTNIRTKLQTLRLVRKYQCVLSTYAIQKALDFSVRLLTHSSSPTQSFIINAAIEDLRQDQDSDKLHTVINTTSRLSTTIVTPTNSEVRRLGARRLHSTESLEEA